MTSQFAYRQLKLRIIIVIIYLWLMKWPSSFWGMGVKYRTPETSLFADMMMVYHYIGSMMEIHPMQVFIMFSSHKVKMVGIGIWSGISLRETNQSGFLSVASTHSDCTLNLMSSWLSYNQAVYVNSTLLMLGLKSTRADWVGCDTIRASFVLCFTLALKMPYKTLQMVT